MRAPRCRPIKCLGTGIPPPVRLITQPGPLGKSGLRP
nr:MAG TPA: hypothetical protein [Caudoviricetes sp.]